MAEQIYGLIAKAMGKVGAIGKDSVNAQQKYKFRGIDAVYNALNPVMSELGLFITPEILEHRREERQNSNGTVLKYSILTIRYTMYAPDGSNVSCVVVGEGMDSGDKASNKAMSVAMKYAMFQMFMIPTEELVDPDAESHEVVSKAQVPAKPQEAKQERVSAPADVSTAQNVPQFDKKPEQITNPVLEYMAKERQSICAARQITKEENAAIWTKQIEVLKGAGLIPNKKLGQFTMQEAENMVGLMYTRFTQTGTELKQDDRETA